MWYACRILLDIQVCKLSFFTHIHYIIVNFSYHVLSTPVLIHFFTAEGSTTQTTVELIHSPVSATGTPYTPSSCRGREEIESLISLTPIVLYYCSCIIAKMPGNYYCVAN